MRQWAQPTDVPLPQVMHPSDGRFSNTVTAVHTALIGHSDTTHHAVANAIASNASARTSDTTIV